MKKKGKEMLEKMSKKEEREEKSGAEILIQKLARKYPLSKKEAEQVFELVFDYAQECFIDHPEDFIDLSALCSDMGEDYYEAMYNL